MKTRYGIVKVTSGWTDPDKDRYSYIVERLDWISADLIFGR